MVLNLWMGILKHIFSRLRKHFSCIQSKFREDKQSGNNTYAIWNDIELQSSVSSDNYSTVMQLVILKRKGTWDVQGCAAGVSNIQTQTWLCKQLSVKS